jgi:GntR family transcriptional regulator / MocR family aminotransferase
MRTISGSVVTDLHVPLDRAAGRLGAQLAAGLRAAIREGRLTAGARLPSSRDLARDLGVSRGVAVTAYEQLIAEGLLVARSGDGTRVAPLARPDQPGPQPVAPAPPPPPIRHDMQPGQPDLAGFPRERWAAAIRAVLGTLPHTALAYPDPSGAPELRAELAGYLGRVRAARATPEQVTVLTGVAHGLSTVLRILAEDGHRTFALEDPTTARQLPMLAAAGMRLVRVPVDDEGIRVADLAATGARAVLVTPAHQYPTGVVLSPARRAELIAWARSVDGVVIEDDYDAEFRYDREPVGCLQGIDPGRVVLTGSVSKSLAPGLRLGWAVAPGWLAARLRAYRELTDLGGPVLEQHALAHLIASGAYDRHLRTMRRHYRARRDVLVQALHDRLPQARVQGVAAGLHVYIELPPGSDEEAVVAAMARAGVAVQGAAPMRSAAGPPALVLGYGAANEARLRTCVELLAQVLGTRLTSEVAG